MEIDIHDYAYEASQDNEEGAELIKVKLYLPQFWSWCI